MATRVEVFRGTLEVARSLERIRAFLKSSTTEIPSITVRLQFVGHDMISAGSMTWPLDGKVEKTIEEIARYISRDDVSVTLST